MNNTRLNILFITQYFSPEIGAGAIRSHELSKYWVKFGDHVEVLTGFPNYPTGKLYPGYFQRALRIWDNEKIDGIQVIRTPIYPTAYKNSFRRIFNYISFLVSASFSGVFIKKPDIVVATSPPLLVGLVGYWISLCKRIPLVFDVRDLWPESLVVANDAYKGSIFYLILDKISGRLYRGCKRLVVVTDGFKAELISKDEMLQSKLCVIKNGVDPEVFKPVLNYEERKTEYGFMDKFIVSYFGTIGISHGVEELLLVAEMVLDSNPQIHFLIAGEGALREKLISLKEEKRLFNVDIWRNQPRETMPLLLSISNVSVVSHVNAPIFDTFIPSKMFEGMACERPILAALKGEAAKIITESDSGLVVERGNPAAMKEAILQLYHDPSKCNEMGRRGRDFVLKYFSREILAKQYRDILMDVIGK
ncbi:glycosyltransferase family 4 protein [candidate division KSB1 bacterium]|nr:glycosyltransferase family 4 protein [candidate division KSB1 bacterium]